MHYKNLAFLFRAVIIRKEAMTKASKTSTKEVILEEKIVAYGIEELCTKVQELVQDGYRMDTTKPNGFPKNFMSTYELSMYKTAGTGLVVTDV